MRKKYSEASGTSAVVDSNITVELNEFGLYEEKLSYSDDSMLDPLVVSVSPSFNAEIDETDISKELFSKIDGIKYDERLGYYSSLYAGFVLEGDYRKNGSSGGMGTWILKELLERGLVDGVIHVKENTNRSSPVLFEYGISTTIEEIQQGAKTRYYPVELSGVLKLVKDTPGKFAIIGIPSFIMSVRLLAKKDPIIKERIVYTVGLICGHQKSSKFAEALAWQVGIKPGDLISVDFRKKLDNQPANKYAVEFTGYIDGKVVTIVKSRKDLLGQNWGEGFFKIYSSDYTDDVANETADIVLGDAWLPQYTVDSGGTNIVIVRSSLIDTIIKEGIRDKKLSLDIVDDRVVFRSLSAHYRHTHDELAYRLYKKDKKGEWRPHKRVSASKKTPFLRRRAQDLREKISIASHIVYKEATEKNDLNYFLTKMSRLSNIYSWLYILIRLRNKILPYDK